MWLDDYDNRVPFYVRHKFVDRELHGFELRVPLPEYVSGNCVVTTDDGITRCDVLDRDAERLLVTCPVIHRDTDTKFYLYY